MVGSVNNTKVGLRTSQATMENMEDDRSDSIHTQKKIMKTCLGIVIWILVCAPSNIVATIFYFKQNQVYHGAMHSDTNILISTNITNRWIPDQGMKQHDAKLNDSTKIANQVSLIGELH